MNELMEEYVSQSYNSSVASHYDSHTDHSDLYGHNDYHKDAEGNYDGWDD